MTNVRVPLVLACPCPGTPHEEEWVDLAAKLPITAGAAAYAAIDDAESGNPAIEAALAPVLLRYGIVAWSFTGDKDPLAITNTNIEAVLDWTAARTILEKANGLYAEDLFRPLAKRLSELLNSGQTDESTSATKPSGPSLPKRSRRSSRASSDGQPSAA